MFKNRSFWGLNLIFILFLIALPDLAKSDDNFVTQNTIKSASELNYPPFSIVRSDGTADGFSVDLLKAVVKIIGKDISFFVGPWNEIKQKLMDGHFDVLPLVSYTKERDKKLDFSTPYLRMRGTIFVRKGEKSITTEADLIDKEVLVMKGDTAHEYAIRKNLSNKLILKDSFEQAMIDLSNGKHDAIIIQRLVGFQLIKKLNISNISDINSFEETSLKPYPKPLIGFEQKFCFAVPEGRKELLSLLNEGLSLVIVNGTFDELYHKWFGPILPQTPVAFAGRVKYLLFFLAPIVFILTIFGIWYLKKEVARKTKYLKNEISRNKKLEHTIRESEEMFRAVFEQAGEYCMILQPNDTGIPTIVNANEAACKTHGYTRDEMIGRPVADIDDEKGKKLCRERTKIIMSGKTLHIETDHVCKDGIVFPVEVFANIIHFENKPPLIVTTEFNISDRKKADAAKHQLEKQLLQAKKMESIGKLAGGIAHDFNNILYPVIGFTQMTIDELPKTHHLQENLQDILYGAKRASDLVKRILLFSRQEEKTLKPKIIKPVVEETLKLLRSSIPANIGIQSKFYDGEDYILCDETEIHEIVMNLCTNAYHSLEETGEIKINLDKKSPPSDLGLPQGEYLCLSVSDNGTGIKLGIKQNIFEPYFTTKEVGKGSGLGLSVVHGIVKSYKGDISVKSDPGKGSVFKVFLPITQKTDDTASEKETLKSSGGTEKILFIDDEMAIVKLGTKSLEKIGYEVTGIPDSLEALEHVKFNPNKFDLVITDMEMPGMVGTQLAKKILEIRPDIPIILCSGYSEKLDKEKSKLLNIKAFIDKPILIKNLTEKVSEILNQSRGV